MFLIMSNAKGDKYYPIFVNLMGKQVLVVGGGQVAERKVKRLLESGASVVLVAPEVTHALQKLVQQGKIKHKLRDFRDEDMNGAWLVVAATDNKDVQTKVYNLANEKQIFCNVVDKPEYCTFIVPSEIRRGDLSIAISTGGKSPALAKSLRIKMEKEFDEGFEEYLDLLGQLREFVKKMEPLHDNRVNTLKALGDLKGMDLYRTQKWDQFLAWCTQICGPEAGQIVQEFLKERLKHIKAC